MHMHQLRRKPNKSEKKNPFVIIEPTQDQIVSKPYPTPRCPKPYPTQNTTNHSKLIAGAVGELTILSS
ncbi:hypothetical protein Hdeb2414_s0080g00779881 [Helianthus debilis subsp. tardiflorus]